MKQKLVHLARLAVMGCLLICTFAGSAFAQKSITVTGKVIDNSGQPVIGAGVTISGTSTGVAADLDGQFQISVPSETTVLTVSALGYSSKDVEVGKRQNLVVVLDDETESLEATVVVAYGTQSKATVTGALASIDSKELVKAPVADVSNVLAGQLPGVTTVQISGKPGDDYADIYVRGVSSLSDGASTPLILVDGVERPLNTIDPNEIESLSILKDAASTAVFGVRGANGVILVTTKRGDAGKPKISVSSITGVQQPLSFLTQVSSYEFAKFWNLKQQNDGVTDPKAYYAPEAIEAYRTGSDPLVFPNTNWKEILYRKAFLQTKNNINISGGSDKVRYFVSMGYMFQDGILKQMPGLSYNNNFSYNRYNYRANLDFKLTETTDMKLNISGVVGKTYEPMEDDGIDDNVWIFTTLWVTPNASPGMVNGIPLTYVGEGPTPPTTRRSGYMTYYNMGYEEKYNTALNLDLAITQRLDFITEGLSLGVKGGYDTNMYIRKQHKGSDALEQRINYKSFQEGDGLAISDPDFDKTYVFKPSGTMAPLSYSESTSADRSWYLEARADYSRKFAGKHAVSGLLLYNQTRDYYPSKYSYLPRGYVGFVARATYGYDDRYLVDVSAGYNGSENFAPGKTRYGLFPSVSLGWVISEEKWMEKVGWIDYLKLRASAGKVGNDLGTSTRFMYMNSVWDEAGSYSFGVNNPNGLPYYTTGTPGNLGVTWETALKYNVGLDFELFNSRLHFSGDIFKEHRTGILISPNSTPGIIATSLPNMNIGIVDNQGYEIELGWKDNVGEFRYSIDANVTFARNEIVYMDEVKSEFKYQNQTGGSTGRNRGLYKFIRLYNYDDFYTDENGVQRLNPDLPQPSATVYPGDCMYADLNKDGKVDGNDTMVYGFADRPEYMFGSNWKFSWKGFNLSLNWIAATNVDKMLEVEYRIPFTNSGNRGLLDYFYRDCWTTENPNGTLPRAAEKSEAWNSSPSTLWLRDASYIRLKSAQFGYTFGRNKFFDRLGINSLNVGFTGYNLLTFTNLTFQDPETVSNNDGVYPLVKTYNLTLNINF